MSVGFFFPFEKWDSITVGLLLIIAHGFLLYGAIQNNDKGMLAYLVLIIVIEFMISVQYLVSVLANHFDQTQDLTLGPKKTSGKVQTVGKVDAGIIIFLWLWNIFLLISSFTLYKKYIVRKDSVTNQVNTV